MTQKAKAPAIRFKGFTDAWEQRTFSVIFTHLKNNSLSRADLNYERGSVKNIHYGDILIKFVEILDVQNGEVPYVSNDEFDVSGTSLLQDGDIIIADAAEDETVGKCSEIRGVMDLNVVSGLHTIPCRPTKSFATGYLGYYMNSTAYHDQLLPLIQGTKVSSISKSALQNTEIIYPSSEDEQRQIGAYFNNLNNLITLHQRKLLKLKNIKKAMLEKMFPKNGSNVPEIRFTGFTDAWKQHKLSEILVEYNERAEKNQGYEHVSLTKEGVVAKTERYDRDSLVTTDNKSYRITRVDDICYNPANLKFGVICRNRYKDAIFSPIYITFKVIEDFSPAFIEKLVTRETFIIQALKWQQGTVYERTSVSPHDLLRMQVLVPTIDEQIIIGRTLTNLDNLITLHQRKLEKLQNLKKACLEKMFV